MHNSNNVLKDIVEETDSNDVELEVQDDYGMAHIQLYKLIEWQSWIIYDLDIIAAVI